MLVRSTKVMIEGKSEVNGKGVQGFRAIVDIDNDCKLTMHPYEIDAEAAKENKAAVRKDRDSFEDYAYEVQDKIKASIKK